MSHKNKKTILMVDDDIDILEQCKMVFSDSKYNIVKASSRKDAEEWLSGEKPDLAIIDLMMETSDAGFILAYHIKKKYPHTPVIILTCVTNETGVEFERGRENSWIKADLFLNKPVRPDQLKMEVRNLLGE